MPCARCGAIRSGLVSAVKRGQVKTATHLAVKGVKHILKAPAITKAMQKRG